jgi:hypothetical protein
MRGMACGGRSRRLASNHVSATVEANNRGIQVARGTQ